jgi:hypothetical protein
LLHGKLVKLIVTQSEISLSLSHTHSLSHTYTHTHSLTLYLSPRKKLCDPFHNLKARARVETDNLCSSLFLSLSHTHTLSLSLSFFQMWIVSLDEDEGVFAGQMFICEMVWFLSNRPSLANIIAGTYIFISWFRFYLAIWRFKKFWPTKL